MKHGFGFEISLKGSTKRKGEWKKNKLLRWLSKTETISGSIKVTNRFSLEQGGYGDTSSNLLRQSEAVYD